MGSLSDAPADQLASSMLGRIGEGCALPKPLLYRNSVQQDVPDASPCPGKGLPEDLRNPTYPYNQVYVGSLKVHPCEVLARVPNLGQAQCSDLHRPVAVGEHGGAPHDRRAPETPNPLNPYYP